jgi:hypothetical protein
MDALRQIVEASGAATSTKAKARAASSRSSSEKAEHPKPKRTGSATFAKMIGMVRVCCSIAAVVAVLLDKMTSGCSATSSFADRCIESASSGVGQR